MSKVTGIFRVQFIIKMACIETTVHLGVRSSSYRYVTGLIVVAVHRTARFLKDYTILLRSFEFL